jgi:DNA mismatch repair protein MutS
VSEELLDVIQCRTLFATHFHELSMINHPRLANRSMEVLDRNGEIIFLRKLKEGPAAESYGIHVARLAGLSERVLSRAREIMERLEESGQRFRAALPTESSSEPPSPVSDTVIDEVSQGTASLQASDEQAQRFIEELYALNENELTPLDSLNLIHHWKQLFDGTAVDKQLPHGARVRKPAQAGNGRAEKGPSLFD